jgi:hypothetical protein
MSETASETDTLLAQRDKLKEDQEATWGEIAWLISDIYRQQHYDPDFPEHLSRWLERTILPRLRRAVGWAPKSEDDDIGADPPV